MLHTVDTDVVILTIVMFNQTIEDKLWHISGTQSNFQYYYIPIHDVVAFADVVPGMDPRICATFPVFHVLMH